MISRKDADPAYPERYPHLFRRCSCAVCNTCWFDVEYGRCIYGGPFSGYVRIP